MGGFHGETWCGSEAMSSPYGGVVLCEMLSDQICPPTWSNSPEVLTSLEKSEPRSGFLFGVSQPDIQTLEVSRADADQ